MTVSALNDADIDPSAPSPRTCGSWGRGGRGSRWRCGCTARTPSARMTITGRRAEAPRASAVRRRPAGRRVSRLHRAAGSGRGRHRDRGAGPRHRGGGGAAGIHRPPPVHPHPAHQRQPLRATCCGRWRSAGIPVGSAHPLAAIADPVDGAERLAGATWGVEGEGAALALAERIVHACGGRALRIAPGGKPAYHAAAVFASATTRWRCWAWRSG